MNLNLTAKTAVVTVASRGIGLATVQTLIDEGVRAMARPAARAGPPDRHPGDVAQARITSRPLNWPTRLTVLGARPTGWPGLSRCATAASHTARTDDLRARAHIYLLIQ